MEKRKLTSLVVTYPANAEHPRIEGHFEDGSRIEGELSGVTACLLEVIWNKDGQDFSIIVKNDVVRIRPAKEGEYPYCLLRSHAEALGLPCEEIGDDEDGECDAFDSILKALQN